MDGLLHMQIRQGDARGQVHGTRRNSHHVACLPLSCSLNVACLAESNSRRLALQYGIGVI